MAATATNAANVSLADVRTRILNNNAKARQRTTINIFQERLHSSPLFPAAILHVIPSKHRKETSRSLVQTVKDRLTDWWNGDGAKLWKSIAALRYNKIHQDPSPIDKKTKKTRRDVSATREGGYGKAVHNLLSDGIHNPSPSIKQALLAKKP